MLTTIPHYLLWWGFLKKPLCPYLTPYWQLSHPHGVCWLVGGTVIWFPSICVDVINYRVTLSSGPLLLRVRTSPACLLTPEHNLTVSLLATCPHSFQSPRHKTKPCCSSVQRYPWVKIQTQVYHVTQGLLNFLNKTYAKSLEFGCLSQHVTHLYPPASLAKSNYPLIQIFSSVHFKGPFFLVYFLFHHLKAFHSQVPCFSIPFFLLLVSYVHSFLCLCYFPFLWQKPNRPKKKEKDPPFFNTLKNPALFFLSLSYTSLALETEVSFGPFRIYQEYLFIKCPLAYLHALSAMCILAH